MNRIQAGCSGHLVSGEEAVAGLIYFGRVGFINLRIRANGRRGQRA